MSDPVSKAEIEDVLSSIRRLVSGDSRAHQRPATPPQAAESSPSPAPGRLVLTPALRVAGDDGAAAENAQPGGESCETEPWRDPDATLYATARVEGTAGNREDQPVADEAVAGDPGDEDQLPVAEPETGEDHPADLAPADDSETVAGGEDPDAARVGTLTAKIQALELAIGQSRDRWEPDGDGDDDYAGTTVETIEWEDHSEAAEAAADPAPERPRSAPEIDDSPDFTTEDDTFLDEDSLRELVADIVRQELMGALGERITRNVRKLVRREIHRALTAQDLD
jgi:hypothetical protein